jgi:HPt (histidine-containing phosphotransfer) domain-containing protein
MLSDSVICTFDTQFAINQFSGNKFLLVQILDKFIKEYQYFDTLITEQLQQEDLQPVKKYLHTLQGVSGNLGMKALHQASKDFEESLANPKIVYTLEKFLRVFKQTFTLIQSFSVKNSIEGIPNIAHQKDRKALLIAALKHNEFISECDIKSYGQSLGLSTEKLSELKQAIDNLDYSNAIALLE